METSEKELAQRAAAGDRLAFDKLVRTNKDMIYASIYRMTGDREATLDLMQETFFAAYRKLPDFRREAKFSSWVYRIAANKTINYLRRKKLISFIPLAIDPKTEPAYEMAEPGDAEKLKKALQEAVLALPPAQRLVFNMRFHEKKKFPEIAGILGRSESTVKTSYQKAIEKLRKKLKDFR